MHNQSKPSTSRLNSHKSTVPQQNRRIKSQSRKLSSRRSRSARLQPSLSNSPLALQSAPFSTTTPTSTTLQTTENSLSTLEIDSTLPIDVADIAVFPVITPSHLKLHPQSTPKAALAAKSEYEEQLRSSGPFRLSEYLKNPSPALRTAILAIPSAVVLYGLHDLSLYTASIVDTVTINEAITKQTLMCLGALQATVAYGLVHNMRKILKLTNHPTEEELQEMIKHALKNDTLKHELGGGMALGHFVSVSSRGGPTRRLNSRRLGHYKEWLKNDPNQFTNPLPEIPVPSFFQKYLALFPAFQTVAWNQRITDKVQKDMQAHPSDYLSDSDERDTTTSSESEHSEDKQPVQQATVDEKEDTTPTVKRDTKPWERIWTPRRVQFAAHLIGHADEGLLLCEFENYKLGPGFTAADSIAQFKVFEFISLTTGHVSVINRIDQPTVLDKAHVQQLLTTVPEPHPVVSVASFDHILVEDKHKKEIRDYVRDEKKKVDVGIYH